MGLGSSRRRAGRAEAEKANRSRGRDAKPWDSRREFARPPKPTVPPSRAGAAGARPGAREVCFRASAGRGPAHRLLFAEKCHETLNEKPRQPRRRGVIAVLAALLMVVLFAMVAFAVDLGYITLVRTQLQAAADSAALAAAGASGQSAPAA